jgi:hypothetical protein
MVEEAKIPAVTPAAVPPAPPVPAEPPAPADPSPASGQPFATFHTKDAFDERLERATRAKLRELGVDPAQAKKDAEDLAAMKAAEEERRAAEMNELEKAQAETEKLKTKAAEAEAEQKKAERAYEIARLGAAHHVSDLEYLAFRIRKLPDGDDRDEWLTKLLEDPVERARFGFEASSNSEGDEIPSEQKKATTSSTTPKGNDAPPPKTGGEPTGGERAMQMTRAEFQAYKRQKYGSTGQGVRKGYKPPPQ